MAQTASKDTDVYALLPDNVTGLISPEDIRRAYASALSKGALSAEQYQLAGDGVTDDTAKMQSLFADAKAQSRPILLQERDYFLRGTIAPDAAFLLISQGATFTFDTAGTYTAILDGGGADTGLDVAFNLRNTKKSSILGHLRLRTNGTWRTGLPGALVGMACSDHAGATNGEGGRSFYNSLNITKFQYGLYQQNKVASNGSLPFTGSRFGSLEIEFCNTGWRTADGANGLDEMWGDTLKINRCNTGFDIASSTLVFGAMFLSGLSSTLDQEGQTTSGTITAPTTSIPITAAGSWVNGDIIAIDGAGIAGHIHVAKVTAGGGTTTLAIDEATVTTITTGKELWRNPTINKIDFSQLSTRRLYIEELFDRALKLERKSSLFADEFEISTGEFCGRKGAIIFSDHDLAFIRLSQASHKATALADRVIYLGRVQNASAVKARRSVEIGMLGTSAADQLIVPVKFGDAIDLPGGYSNVSPTDDHVVVRAGNGAFKYATDTEALSLIW